MDDGRVIERGTHDALIQARGTYHGMEQRQMEAASRGESDVWE